MINHWCVDSGEVNTLLSLSLSLSLSYISIIFYIYFMHIS
jgi:hypothetical protein